MLDTASWRSRQMCPEPPGEEPLRLEFRRDWTVEDRHLYNPTGPSGDARHKVLSSPSMIWEMEITCTELAKRVLGGEVITVGFHVDVKHVSPARSGATITTVAVLTARDVKKLTFKVEAREGDRLVGTGRHRRAVIDPGDLG